MLFRHLNYLLSRAKEDPVYIEQKNPIHLAIMELLGKYECDERSQVQTSGKLR